MSLVLPAHSPSPSLSICLLSSFSLFFCLSIYICLFLSVFLCRSCSLSPSSFSRALVLRPSFCGPFCLVLSFSLDHLSLSLSLSPSLSFFLLPFFCYLSLSLFLSLFFFFLLVFFASLALPLSLLFASIMFIANPDAIRHCLFFYLLIFFVYFYFLPIQFVPAHATFFTSRIVQAAVNHCKPNIGEQARPQNKGQLPRPRQGLCFESTGTILADKPNLVRMRGTFTPDLTFAKSCHM